MSTGIYCIEDLTNNKKYIGKSGNLGARKGYHFSRLKNNKHCNKYLQEAYNKYGKNNFIFYVVEECFKEVLDEREIYWIAFYDTTNLNMGYNLTDGGDGAPFGEKNWRFGKGLPEHLIGKGFKCGKENYWFGKKSYNSYTSKYLGVSRVFQSGKVYWRARVKVKGIRHNIGYFKTEEQAALGYNKYIVENNIQTPLNIVK